MSHCSNDQISLKFFYTEPHPPTNLSAVVQCKQGYEIQINWQVRNTTNSKIYIKVIISEISLTFTVLSILTSHCAV